MLEMEGVVNIEVDPRATPPTELANHFNVPVEEDALMTTEPVPQRPSEVDEMMMGKGMTVTFTEFVSEHPVAVMVSVSTYVVVDKGLAEGCEMVASSSVVEGDQEYVRPEVVEEPMETPAEPQII